MLLRRLLVILIVSLIIWWLSYKNKVTYHTHYSDLDPNFRTAVRDIISKSGWCDTFIIKEVDNDADVNIFLTERSKMPGGVKREYYPDGSPIYFSETNYVHKPVINIDSVNWLEGVKASKMTLDQYREYVITHEIGHALGYDHAPCKSGTCPVMYQATRGCPDDTVCGSKVSHVDYNNILHNKYI